MKKLVCVGVPKPGSITQHKSDSEHSTPLTTSFRAQDAKFNTLTARFYLITKCKSYNLFSLTPKYTISIQKIYYFEGDELAQKFSLIRKIQWRLYNKTDTQFQSENRSVLAYDLGTSE